MADVRELRPVLNRAVRHHLGISPIDNVHTAPRPSTGSYSIIWHLHFGILAAFLIGVLLLMLLGRM